MFLPFSIYLSPSHLTRSGKKSSCTRSHKPSKAEWPDWSNFSILGDFLLWAVSIKSRKLPKFSGCFLAVTVTLHFWTKHGLGHFFTQPSGHPVHGWKSNGFVHTTASLEFWAEKYDRWSKSAPRWIWQPVTALDLAACAHRKKVREEPL
jgi:hypothetical protein